MFREPRCLIHLYTLSGLGMAMAALLLVMNGDVDNAARLLLGVLVIDYTDGTLARRFRVREKLPAISGEVLDTITDVVGLTFVPMVFFLKAGLFLHGWGPVLCVIACMVCSLKYAMKPDVLERGVSRGAPPVFFALFLCWFLHAPPLVGTVACAGLVVLCLSPLEYPITSLVTTHWKPGWQSITNYLVFASMIPVMIWLDRAPAAVYWVLAANMAAQLLVFPWLLTQGLVPKGFRRVY